MAGIKVANYDLAEQEALVETPNRVIEAFQPVTFTQIGYPVRVRQEAELFRYIDTMHDSRFENDYSNLLGGITESEFELLKKLTSTVSNFSELNFNRKAISRSSLIRMINVLRHIQYLSGNSKLRVFEVGPGSGYLGAMLILLGYPYAATDITQSFYLYQNYLWDFVSGGKLIEGAETKISRDILQNILPGSVVHVPWWEYARMRPESVPHFDIVTCNHAVCEMHPNSLRFTARITHAFLESENPPKAFVFEGWGWKSSMPSKVGSVAEATDIFYRFGFSLVYNDSRFTIFAPTGTPSSIGSFPWEQLSSSYVPYSFAAQNNSLVSSIMAGRQETQSQKKVSLETVNQFYTELLGSENHLPPDEEFLKLLGMMY